MSKQRWKTESYKLSNIFTPKFTHLRLLCLKINPQKLCEETVESLHASAQREVRAVDAGINVKPAGTCMCMRINRKQMVYPEGCIHENNLHFSSYGTAEVRMIPWHHFLKCVKQYLGNLSAFVMQTKKIKIKRKQHSQNKSIAKNKHLQDLLCVFSSSFLSSS